MPTTDGERARRRLRLSVVGVAVVVAVMSTALFVFGRRVGPAARSRVIRVLEKRFHADVRLGSLSITLFPRLRATGQDLTISLRDDSRNLPPFLSVRQFAVEAGIADLFRETIHIRKLRLDGLQINVPPKQEDKQAAAGEKRPMPELIVDEICADGTVLRIHSTKPDRQPLEFDLHELTLHSIGRGQPMSFDAKLTNATPPGMIKTQGRFGPWDVDDLSLTPVSGRYEFRDADLSVFRGLSGKLSSDGAYEGKLEHIEVRGDTDTPAFAVSGEPVHLRTEFNAIVDGTSGDTLLRPVTAHFLNSTIVAEGGVVNIPGAKGKSIVLNVSANGARIEDLMRLAVKHTPPLTGTIHLKTRFELPPGQLHIVDRLNLDGHFALEDARFTDRNVQDKILTLSRRGRGINKEEEKQLEKENVLSDLGGDFTLRNATLSFARLSFQVPGATVLLHGSYGLHNENVDFTGDLRLRASASETTSGIKSFLLKPFDRVFRKGKFGTVLPIKVTGTGDHPDFGIDKGKLLPFK